MDLERWNEIEKEARAYAKECGYDPEHTEEYVSDQLQQAVEDAEEWAGWMSADE
ncbi:hypothetical protein [Lacticaseibacillus rhamnosus]|uniref:hypothetical protein n=1 Tax=Lacticaseibacillus rhamnosus TaxID=47715 RepID=UPI00237FAB05|nr:hypothetical protein [Lacticaseibacillus rhamnosus]MDE3296846.1 hypothetical protein [Lacticaseibacillus rhamnosus]